MLKALYVQREDGDYDFLFALDCGKLDTLDELVVDDAESVVTDMVMALQDIGEDVCIHTEGSISDFPDVLTKADMFQRR